MALPRGGRPEASDHVSLSGGHEIPRNIDWLLRSACGFRPCFYQHRAGHRRSADFPKSRVCLSEVRGGSLLKFRESLPRPGWKKGSVISEWGPLAIRVTAHRVRVLPVNDQWGHDAEIPRVSAPLIVLSADGSFGNDYSSVFRRGCRVPERGGL